MARLTVVSYAINGRGLGHLTRQLAILRWMRRLATVAGVKLEAWVLTSSEADTLARREGFPALKIPSKAMMRDAGLEPSRYLAIARSWVVQTIAGLQPDLLLVDTFPAGSFGEMISALELARRRVLIARSVKASVEQEQAYQALLPLYHDIIIPDETGVGPILLRDREELPSRHQAREMLGVFDQRRIVYLTLGGGGDPTAIKLLPRLMELLRNDHLVVGAGPLYNGPEIRRDGVTWLDRYTAMELFPAFDAAVSAGGYNTLNELMYSGVPTVFLPQLRIADDQAARVARAVSAGAACLAKTVEEIPHLLQSPGSPAAARALVPHNGARVAAARILAGVLPPEDIDRAMSIFQPALLANQSARELAPATLLELMRILGGESPSSWRRHRAIALDFVECGTLSGEIPEHPPTNNELSRFLKYADERNISAELDVTTLLTLHRKFPNANPTTLVNASISLGPLQEQFDDPPGWLALLRAIPTQRIFSLEQAAQGLLNWLPRETDLFLAQRAMLRLEDGGRRTFAEVLRLLAERDVDNESLL